MSESQLDYALALRRKGWYPIPLCWPKEGACACPRQHDDSKDIGKAPLVGPGWQSLRPSEADIQKWWANWPRANIGVLLSPSGLLSVDPDSPEALQEARDWGLPSTVRRVSLHDSYLYLRPESCPITQSNKNGSGALDVKTSGYVVVRGWHRTGVPILLDLDGPQEPAAAPQWAVDLLRDVDARRAERAQLPDILPPAPDVNTLEVSDRIKVLILTGKGDRYPSRSEGLFAVLQALIGAGYDDGTIASVVLAHPIGEKAEEQGRTWLASEIGRARARAGDRAEEQHKEPSASQGTGPALPPLTLGELTAIFGHWLHFPKDGEEVDFGPLYFDLAVMIANRQAGDPVWGLEVAAPGSGKTERLMSFAGLPKVHMAATLTEAALLSGTAKKDKAPDAKGGLLRAMGDFGILLVKDFGGILSLNRDSRASILQALREVYDGHWTRWVGTDGGRCLSWAGKVGMIGGATPGIDAHHSVMAILGERFVFYRLPEGDAGKLGAGALAHLGAEDTMRRDLSEAVTRFFSGLEIPQAPRRIDAGSSVGKWLIALATFTARCRSAVIRDPMTRQVEVIAGAEAPTRLVLAFARILDALELIGLAEKQARELVLKVGLDSMPTLRRRVIRHLAGEDAWQSTPDIAVEVHHPTETTRRALEDLHCYGLIERQTGGRADEWRLAEHYRALYGQVFTLGIT